MSKQYRRSSPLDALITAGAREMAKLEWPGLGEDDLAESAIVIVLGESSQTLNYDELVGRVKLQYGRSRPFQFYKDLDAEEGYRKVVDVAIERGVVQLTPKGYELSEPAKKRFTDLKRTINGYSLNKNRR